MLMSDMKRRGPIWWFCSRVRQDERGFTLIELMVALTVFAILLAGSALVFSGTLKVAGQNRYRSVAANLASQELDTVRGIALTNFSSLPVGQVSKTQTVDSIVYTIDREAEWVTQNATVGACDGASGGQLAYLSETVSVSWPNMQGVSPVTTTTILTPPVGTYDPNTGHIAVKIVDRESVPEELIPVTITGPSGTQNQSTTSDGCAFFAYLTAGTYTVSLGTANFVDGQGTANPTQSVAVTVGAIASVAFDYDLASALNLTLAADSGGAYPSSVPVTLGNTSLLPLGTKVFSGSGSPRLLSNLFPYLSGYEAWVGDCADADPEGKNGSGVAFYPTGQRAAPIQTTPGSTTLGTVALRTVSVHVQRSSGVPRSGATVTVHHDADNGCAAGVDYTLPGTTDVNGNMTASLPYGRWQFKVSGRVPFPGPSWPYFVLDPTKPTPTAVTVVTT
jgi:prepilin-type N-terminal cleavage/methylation domain-containing protein